MAGTTSRRGGRWLVLLLVVAIVPAGACSSGSSADREPARSSSTSSTSVPRPPPTDPPPAATAAAAALGQMLGEVDTASLAILDYLARRWDWPQLAGAGDRARRLVREGEHGGGSTVLDGLVDAGAPPAPAAELDAATASERLIARALRCGPRSAGSMRRAIGRFARNGGYDATHAAFALVLADERCPARDEQLRRSLVARIARELRADATIDDLTIERMAMLVFLDAASAVPPERVAGLVDAQRPDGAWGEQPGGPASWHPTMLALWALSGLWTPGAPVDFAPR